MAFVSQAQRRKFQELVDAGKLNPETFAKWESETKGELPLRVAAKPGKPPKAKGVIHGIKGIKAK